MDNFSLASYPWQQMSARQHLKILFCRNAWHNKNKPRISVLVERARASAACAGRQSPDRKRGSGCHSWYQYPLSPDYTQFGSRKTLLGMTNKYQPVVPPHQATSALPKASPCVTVVTLMWLQSAHTSTCRRTMLNQEHQLQKAKQNISPHGNPHRFVLLSSLVAQATRQ